VAVLARFILRLSAITDSSSFLLLSKKVEIFHCQLFFFMFKIYTLVVEQKDIPFRFTVRPVYLKEPIQRPSDHRQPHRGFGLYQLAGCKKRCRKQDICPQISGGTQERTLEAVCRDGSSQAADRERWFFGRCTSIRIYLDGATSHICLLSTLPK